MKYQIHKQQHFLNIPSGSGIEIWNDHIYIVGDDSYFLYQLDKKWNLVAKIPILPLAATENGRIAKKDKPDFEAMTLWEEAGETSLLFLGSGSKSPQRDVACHFFSPEKIMQKTLTPLYNTLRKVPQIVELNIEAAIQWEGKLVLCQRGGTFQKNALILVEKEGFELIDVILPPINGVQAGISGAAYCAAKDLFLFCASAEATTDAYNDGEILGSLIGKITDFSQKMKKKQVNINDFVILTEIPKQKIESIAIAEFVSDNEMVLFAVADNDDGSSFLFEIGIS